MNHTLTFFILYAVFTLTFLAQCQLSDAHGFLLSPLPRGGLARGKFIPTVFDPKAPRDETIHFPAGDKIEEPKGRALKSQKAAALGRPWQPFKPMQADYNWRYGVCGDLKEKPDHLSGGYLYYGAKIVATYTEGDTIDVQAKIIFHHGGFFIFHLCDISKCPGDDIDEDCFKTPGACTVLNRVVTEECESGASDRCSPIDRNFPERWYLPCSTYKKKGDVDVYGVDGTMRMQLPEGFHCEHCVLHQHWESADRCTPNGYKEYYEGPDAPQKSDLCGIVGHPVNGRDALLLKDDKDKCTEESRKLYTEDYAHCSDIRVVGNGEEPILSLSPTPLPSVSEAPPVAVSPSPSPTPPTNGFGHDHMQLTPSPKVHTPDQGPIEIRDVAFLVNGEFQEYLPRLPRSQVVSRSTIYVKPYSTISFYVYTAGVVGTVNFYVNDMTKDTVHKPPFILGATPGTKPLYVDSFLHKTLHLKVLASNMKTGEKVRKIYRLEVEPKGH